MSGLTPNGYGSKAIPREVESDKRILAAAKENFGQYEVTLSGVWGGLFREVAVNAIRRHPARDACRPGDA